MKKLSDYNYKDLFDFQIEYRDEKGKLKNEFFEQIKINKLQRILLKYCGEITYRAVIIKGQSWKFKLKPIPERNGYLYVQLLEKIAAFVPPAKSKVKIDNSFVANFNRQHPSIS